MKAIILSAGEGTRIRAVNQEIPKVLIEVCGKPMLKWNIDLLKKFGVTDIAINTHFMSDKIKDYLGDGSEFGVNIKYSYEPELLGTSGSLNNFRDFFDEPFFVIYGDIISTMNLEKVIEFHKNNNCAATLVVHKSSHPEDSDIVQMDEDGRITRLVHKPGDLKFGDMGNAAMYIVEPKIFEYLDEGKSDFVKDVFPKMIENGERIYGYDTQEFLKDAGTPERLTEVEKHLNKMGGANDNI